MPLSIVSSDERAGSDPASALARPADLVMISCSDAELARYALAWHGAGCDLPALYLAKVQRLLPHPEADLRAAIATARAVLIHLPHGLDDWRRGIEGVAASARDRRIALAVVAAADPADPALDALSNLPRTTLRRLAALCHRSDARSARAVLTQLSLAAGLPIAPWLDAPTDAVPELVRGEAR
ncbi:hypothetical protein [Rhodopseudomonas telluris]|uniref:Uncharacterized protein n=1 Tax=Rhodopseudomonas telluris TaxID=644215 RepID=A0ABV6EWA0_9BRAD